MCMFFSSTWDFPIETIEIIQTTDGQSRHKKQWQAVHLDFRKVERRNIGGRAEISARNGGPISGFQLEEAENR